MALPRATSGDDAPGPPDNAPQRAVGAKFFVPGPEAVLALALLAADASWLTNAVASRRHAGVYARGQGAEMRRRHLRSSISHGAPVIQTPSAAGLHEL
jgi:hypothetical protein